MHYYSTTKRGKFLYFTRPNSTVCSLILLYYLNNHVNVYIYVTQNVLLPIENLYNQLTFKYNYSIKY